MKEKTKQKKWISIRYQMVGIYSADISVVLQAANLFSKEILIFIYWKIFTFKWNTRNFLSSRKMKLKFKRVWQENLCLPLWNTKWKKDRKGFLLNILQRSAAQLLITSERYYSYSVSTAGLLNLQNNFCKFQEWLVKVLNRILCEKNIKPIEQNDFLISKV